MGPVWSKDYTEPLKNILRASKNPLEMKRCAQPKISDGKITLAAILPPDVSLVES
jgi:hypothetical protein